ncbi:MULTISPECIES: MMPL family transporter [unclassified Streptomyces]|uniref:MMPL family transporter n=1 Tax=unclassified Streptomyces TaxID=2593676 RepID=UPI002E36C967|nr:MULTISPECIES: MMPL family transporter [unclassified Streptomyces]WUC63603.1 MMPL family transporter [Streptomyces sp. NBC_00539]
MPATLMLLLLVFGSIPAAFLPLAVGAVAVTGTTAILRALVIVTPVSAFALSLTTAVGLALAVDYSLFFVARYREETASGVSHDQALIRATCTAGRTVVVSAGIVAAALLGLLVFPLTLIRSLAIAGISVVLLAAIASLLIIPAALACFGERLASRDILARRRRSARSAARWLTLATAVMRRPVTVFALTSALLLLLALPFRDAVFSLSDERALPADSSIARDMQDLRTDFPQVGAEVDVVLPYWHPAGRDGAARLDAYARRLSGPTGVQGLRTATGTYLNGKPVGPLCVPSSDPAPKGPCHRAAAVHPADRHLAGHRLEARPYSPQRIDLLHSIRTQPGPTSAPSRWT